jgi:hypothetical protein
MRYLLAFLFILVILINLYVGTNQKIVEGATNKNNKEQSSSTAFSFMKTAIAGYKWIWKDMWISTDDYTMLMDKEDAWITAKVVISIIVSFVVTILYTILLGLAGILMVDIVIGLLTSMFVLIIKLYKTKPFSDKNNAQVGQ